MSLNSLKNLEFMVLILNFLWNALSNMDCSFLPHPLRSLPLPGNSILGKRRTSSCQQCSLVLHKYQFVLALFDSCKVLSKIWSSKYEYISQPAIWITLILMEKINKSHLGSASLYAPVRDFWFEGHDMLKLESISMNSEGGRMYGGIACIVE